jgi:hypothetical protein
MDYIKAKNEPLNHVFTKQIQYIKFLGNIFVRSLTIVEVTIKIDLASTIWTQKSIKLSLLQGP